MKEIAIYLRLSKADKERTRESQSIQNQRALLYKAIREDASFGEYPITAYIDDGYSGLQQDRPALCAMMQKIRQKKVVAVFVKDLSRLSRNHVFLAGFMEKFCPTYQVDLIAVGDGYDSRKEQFVQTATRLRALFYECYSKDISYKVRNALRSKKENGEYAVARPPFGYRWDHKGIWRTEPEEAKCIRRIYESFLRGDSQKEIALKESARGFTIYPVKVHRILHDPVYCGYFIWNKNRMSEYIPNKNIILPRDEWKVQKGTHEAIISETVFLRVWQKLQKVSQDNKKFVKNTKSFQKL